MLGMLRRRSLFWTLGFALIAVQSVAMLALAWFTLGRVSGFAREQTLTNLTWLVPLLDEPYAELRMRDASRDEIDAYTKRMGGRVGVRLTYIAPDGLVLGDSNHDIDAMDNHGTRPEVLEAREMGRGSATRFSDTLEYDYIYHASRHESPDGELLGFIRVSVPEASVSAQVNRLLVVIIVVMVLALVISFLVVSLISRRMSRAVSNLGSVATEFASGHITHKEIEAPGREFRDLTRALNNMARQLKDQIEQLETQRNELDAILRSMESGVIALDLDRRVLRLNKAARRMLGIWDTDARGRLIEEVTDQPALIDFVKHALAQDGKASDQFELYGALPMVVRIVKRSLTDADENLTGVVVIINDITRLKRLEGIRTDFAANVSHELRTPITNIKGYVETLRETSMDNPEQFASFLDVIDRNTGRLGAIVEDMLALTRIEQSDTNEGLEREPRQIAEIVRTVFSHLEGEAGDREIRLELDASPDTSAIVNSPLMEQAIMNLVSNSIKYTHPRTAVRVLVRRLGPKHEEAGSITIAVEDRGPGIAPEHLPRIFERFYRVDKARSRAVGGTGLGLAIVKHIAIVHGGRVEVQSEVGSGTTFTIIIPPTPEELERQD